MEEWEECQVWVEVVQVLTQIIPNVVLEVVPVHMEATHHHTPHNILPEVDHKVNNSKDEQDNLLLFSIILVKKKPIRSFLVFLEWVEIIKERAAAVVE